MAKKSKFKKRTTKFTLPLAVVAGFTPTVVGVWNRRNSVADMAGYLQIGWTGISTDTGKFNFQNLRAGMIPALAGFAVHMIAGKIGLNRAIARAGIPILRI